MLTQELKEAVWQRQKGMCALTGKKFETADFSECEFHWLKSPETGGSSTADNVVMLWKSADMMNLPEGTGADKSVLKKYYFPHGGFLDYSYEDKLSDVSGDVANAIEFASSTNNWREIRTKLKEIVMLLNSSNLESGHHKELMDKVNLAYDSLTERQNAEKEKSEKELAANYESIAGLVGSAVEFARGSADFKAARERLIAAQNDFRAARLSQEHRQELFANLNDAFDDLNTRQTAERENFEMECIENYHNLKSKVDEAIHFATTTLSFGKARENLIEVQGMIKEKKLKREQRDELYQSIRDCFDRLNQRQSVERDEFDKECQANYEHLKKVTEEAIAFSQNTTDYKEAREALIHAQGAIKGMKLKREQRDELYAEIRAVFESINSRQSEEREEFDKESARNYEALSAKINQAAEDVKIATDFRMTRDMLIAIQNEVKILKLKKEQRNELFARIREAFNQFDERRKNYFDSRHEEKVAKLKSIKANLQTKVDRLRESLERDKESLAFQETKLAEVRPGEKEEEIKNEISDKIQSIKARIEEKDSKIKESDDRITDIDKEIDQA